MNKPNMDLMFDYSTLSYMPFLTSFPFQEDLMKRKFSGFFIKESDISLMQEALQHVQPALDELHTVLEKKDSEFEMIFEF